MRCSAVFVDGGQALLQAVCAGLFAEGGEADAFVEPEAEEEGFFEGLVGGDVVDLRRGEGLVRRGLRIERQCSRGSLQLGGVEGEVADVGEADGSGFGEERPWRVEA